MFKDIEIIDNFNDDIKQEIEGYDDNQIRLLCSRISNSVKSFVKEDFTEDRCYNITKFLESRFDVYQKIHLLRLLISKKIFISTETLAEELVQCLEKDITLKGLKGN